MVLGLAEIRVGAEAGRYFLIDLAVVFGKLGILEVSIVHGSFPAGPQLCLVFD